MGFVPFLEHRFGTSETPPGQQAIWTLAVIKQIHDSYTFFASNFCYVADKNDDLVLLRPFVGQAIHRVTIDSQLRNELPGRVCEVKARQLGWTTENIARALHFSLDENRRSLLLVDDEDVAAELATRLGTMLNGLPGFMQPMRRIQNMKHLVFDNPNPKDRADNPGLNAAIQITVPSSFRGVSVGFVCISEYAHMEYERQMLIQAGLSSIAKMNSSSIFVYDTTPNGIDESYYPMVMEAVEDNPKWSKRIENWKGELSSQDVMNGVLGVPDAVERGYPGVYVPAICPWRLHEEYSARSALHPRGAIRPMTKAQRDETESTLGKLSKYGGEEETELRDKFGVSIERIFWRRRQIDQYKFPTEEMKLLTFRQEYLTTVESAFIDSGTAPFDRSSMDKLSRMEHAPKYTGLFREEGAGNFIFDRTALTQWQEVRIYEGAKQGEKYTMGVDTDVAYESPDSDATVAQVVRFSDNKVVCTYEARVPSHLLMEQLLAIYRLYFNCYYAIETAGMGYDLVRRCYDRGMQNCHYYKRYDADNPEPTKYPGWETKAQTRALMDQTFTELLCQRNRSTGAAEPDIIIPDAKTIREIRGLSRSADGFVQVKPRPRRPLRCARPSRCASHATRTPGCTARRTMTTRTHAA